MRPAEDPLPNPLPRGEGVRSPSPWEGLGEGLGLNLITFDMGGTSTDVALCAGQTPTTTEGMIAELPLRLPLIDIHTVGAGGGSLAYLDAGGALQVGPHSAGAHPGPAGYHADYDAWRAMWTTGEEGARGQGPGSREERTRSSLTPGTWPLFLHLCPTSPIVFRQPTNHRAH